MVIIFRACFIILLLASPARAADDLTCTGQLSEGSRTAWIVDHSAGYTCIVNLRGFDHDPMLPCSGGGICRVTGRGHSGSTDKIYVIDEIKSVNREQPQPPELLREKTGAPDRVPLFWGVGP